MNESRERKRRSAGKPVLRGGLAAAGVFLALCIALPLPVMGQATCAERGAMPPTFCRPGGGICDCDFAPSLKAFECDYDADPDCHGPPNGTYFWPGDVVVIAIGQSPNPMIPNTTSGLETGRRGNITVDEGTMKTSKKGVFAGGDVATGGVTVILAMGQGKIAAEAIVRRLVRS